MKKLKRMTMMLSAVLLAVFLVGCEGPVSPVGESKTAERLRGSRNKQQVAGTNGSQDAARSLSAGINTDNISGQEDQSVSDNTVTDGDPDGVHLELWTYDSDHVAYYRKLLKDWNDQDPDYTLEITFRTLPNNELHETLLESLKSGEGAPDICDVDAYRFPEILKEGGSLLYPLDVAAAPYLYDLHSSRTDVYRGEDNILYAVPFRMGAAVQYWNMEALEEAGITQKEVDAVVTWEDYNALGEKFKSSSQGAGKYFTAINKADPVWPMLAMAEFSEDAENIGNATAEMTTLHQTMLDSQTAKSSENISQDIATGSIVSFTESLAFTNRFVEDMHDETGRWYITKCPVFAEGQPCSVCLDDTATVITAGSRGAALAADFICYAKLYTENARTMLWPDLSYDVCNMALWEDETFAHDVTHEYNTFFRDRPYDVLKEIKDRIATVKP